MAKTEKIFLPDVGDFDEIEIIEVLISAGDNVEAEDSIITLESDKATMEIPTPFSGVIQSVAVKVGDRISQGNEIAVIETAETSSDSAIEAEPAESVQPKKEKVVETPDNTVSVSKPPPVPPAAEAAQPGRLAHASPAIRRFARELGVDVSKVSGSGNKGRILKEDVQQFVKTALSSGTPASSGSGLNVSDAPVIDFSKFGEIETTPLSRIKKISGAHLHRSWVTVPHVTQFDEADISDLEAFRKSLSKEAEKKGVRLTPLVFIMKAVVSALQEYPEFNASLDASGENLILKKYFHLGVAVDTPNGLMVPVIRNVDQKGIYELSAELAEIALKTREGKLSPSEMQGGCFSISSLGGDWGNSVHPDRERTRGSHPGCGKIKNATDLPSGWDL